MADETLRITAVDHAIVLLQTRGGLAAVTDANRWFGNVDVLPDIVTWLRIQTRLRASVVNPMHWFGRGTPKAFLTGMTADFDILWTGENSLTVPRGDLPSRPTVTVLDPAGLRAAA